MLQEGKVTHGGSSVSQEQSGTGVGASAEERTQETRRFVRTVRRATRRRYTSEEKIRIVLEGFRRETTVNDLCRREGIKPANYYSWTKEFMEAGKERLARDSVLDATHPPRAWGQPGGRSSRACQSLH